MAALFVKFGQRPDAEAILEASYRNDYALMATLLASYPYLDEEVFAEPLPMAARLGNVNAVKAMLDTRKAPLKYLHKALIWAALREEMAVVKYLIAAGVDINARDPQGCTPLHYLAADATVESVQYLLDKGAAINATCRGRQTPLNWAYSGNSSGVIDLLIRNGAVK
jgi:ankyrin repeat protein